MKKLFAFLVLVAFTGAITEAQIFGKKPVKKTITTLTRHPDEISLIGGSDTKYYFMVTDEGLFFTGNRSVWDEISSYLPALAKPGTVVELEGTKINPFTHFNKKQLKDVSRRAGKKIKKYNVFIISGHSLTSSSSSGGTMKYIPPGN